MTDQYFLIRYIGGSGADTLANVIENSINRENSRLLTHDSNNRATYVDLFDHEFTYMVSNVKTRTDLGLPELWWREYDDDQIRSVVEYWKAKNVSQRIGKCHYLLPFNLDYRYAFNGFKIIDLYPRSNDAWILHALHIFKSALRKRTGDYQRYSVLFDGSEPLFAEHVRSHGWWPEWWAWSGPKPIDKFIIEISDETTVEPLPAVTDLLIESLSMVLDENLPWIPEFESKTGVEVSDRSQIEYLTNWIRKNNEIIDYLGLRDHLGKDYTWERKKSMLVSLFLNKRDDILSRN